jgi:23S rRNA (adenine2503-C2)-methyltransferase
MDIILNLRVPTGNILVCQASKGPLELLSLADYGQDVNLNQNKPVTDGTPLLPLSEKWVLTISTQYGCSMGCTFCDVPKVGPGRNATYEDLRDQVLTGLALHSEVKATKRLNVHFARMGEPTWNPDVLEFAKNIRHEVRPLVGPSLVHPVVSTMMPRHNSGLFDFLDEWMMIKNYHFNGDAGLQISVNSTSDDERETMFSGNALSLQKVSGIGKALDFPKGRKITLNFAVAGYEIDADKLRNLFDPDRFVCKLTPMHKTTVAVENGIETDGDYTTPYPYQHHAEALRKVGFDVLTFIASHDEDAGRITCGNAILSGTLPHKFEDVTRAL